ncbi:MAG: acyl-CoA thioesterase II [Micropruina sp.]|nr:acyl-CoA thioesterase II [Micropruina sp.]
MPQTVGELVALLNLEQIDVDLFRATPASTSLQRVFGGQVLAQALAAAYRTVQGDRAAHSLSAYFLRPGATTSPLLYQVETTRDGRSFSSRRVVARQGGRPIFSMSSSFHIVEPGLDHSDPLPDGVPVPDACPLLSEVLGARSARASAAWEAEWGALEVRYAGDAGAPGAAAMRVWVRAEGRLPDDPITHQLVIAYLSDLTLLGVSTVPHPVVFGSPSLQAASINHSMWFHRPTRADQWLLYDQVSPSASGALGFSFGRLFSQTALVGSCAQEGLIRMVDEVGENATTGRFR